MGCQIFSDFRNLIICTAGQIDNRLHEAMVHEFVAKLDSALIFENIKSEIRKPIFYGALQISRRFILRRQSFQFDGLLNSRHRKLGYIHTGKELLGAQTIFGNDCVLIKRLTEDFFSIAQNVTVVLFGTHRCGRTNAA